MLLTLMTTCSFKLSSSIIPCGTIHHRKSLQRSFFMKLSLYFNIHEITTYNGLTVAAVPALCMYLKHYAYPCRYGDLVYHFARPVPEISIINNHIMDLIYGRWHHLLTRYNHDLLSPPKLRQYTDAIQQAGAALDNCWGFIDGTVRPVCRPKENQRSIYNGHKPVHCIKFQAVALPNGSVRNLFGPIEGRRHDSFMLAASGFLQELHRFSNCPVTGLPLCVYGDPAIRYVHTYRGPTKSQSWPQLNKILTPQWAQFALPTSGYSGILSLNCFSPKEIQHVFVLGDVSSSAHDVLRVLEVVDILFLFCCFSFNTSCTSCNLPLLRSSSSLL